MQRYIFKEEARFFNALANRYAVIVDLYEDTPWAAGGQVYGPQQPFTTQRASPFEKPI